MSFKQMIITTVALSGMVLTIPFFAPPQSGFVSEAQAETNISVNFNIGSFYDRLEPYGNWVSYEDDYVFIPRRVARDWRPYSRGHWSYTRQYGWLWVSNERFGWATYHYGRWGYSRQIGWYWVPGRRWAPAWVAWGHSGNEVAWAPLPPRRRGSDVDINITIGDVPDYYWQAVPTSAFLSINLSDNIIQDRGRVRNIVRQTRPETVRIENNIVINNVIQVQDIERATKTKVKVFEETAASSPDAAGKIDKNSVAIFNPVVNDDKTVKPRKQRKLDEIVSERKAQGGQPLDLTADQPTDVTKPLNQDSKTGKPDRKPAADVPAAPDTLNANDGQNPDMNQQGQGKRKKGRKEQSIGNEPQAIEPGVDKPLKKREAVTPPANDVVTPPANNDNANVESPVEKRKMRKKSRANTDSGGDNGVQSNQQQNDGAQQADPQQDNQRKARKKQRQEQQQQEPAVDGGQPPVVEQQPVEPEVVAPGENQAPAGEGRKKRRNGGAKGACDPNIENCSN